MVDWSDFAAEASSRPEKGPRCSIHALIAEVPEADRDAVRRVIESPERPASVVAKALKVKLGAEAPTAHTIGRHRRGECKCRIKEGRS